MSNCNYKRMPLPNCSVQFCERMWKDRRIFGHVRKGSQAPLSLPNVPLTLHLLPLTSCPSPSQTPGGIIPRRINTSHLVKGEDSRGGNWTPRGEGLRQGETKWPTGERGHLRTGADTTLWKWDHLFSLARGESGGSRVEIMKAGMTGPKRIYMKQT